MDTRLETMERLFQALGDATRLRILGLLLTGEVCVCHIHESLKVSQPKASRHLAYLRRAGLVETRKEGLWVHYRLAPIGDDVTRTLLDAVYHCLGHLTTVAQDGKRLEKKTGCCATPMRAPTFCCCAPPAASDDRTAVAAAPTEPA